jgi:hypothetical protein
MEISEKRNQQYILEVFRISCKVAHVLDHAAEEDYPKAKERSARLSHIVIQRKSDMPEKI